MHPLVFLCFLVLASCSTPARKQPSASLLGDWVSSNPHAIFYRTLTFADSTAVFTSLGDTIYRFQYHLTSYQPQHLVLTDPHGKQASAMLLKLSPDSLVVNQLWELSTPQRFARRHSR